MLNCEVLAPQGSDGLIAYLSSGLFSGIGEKTAEKLIGVFGESLPGSKAAGTLSCSFTNLGSLAQKPFGSIVKPDVFGHGR